MKAILLLTILCIAQNCSNKKSVYNDSICRDTYPTLIDSLNVSDLYDNAKWSLYTWNCDKVYLPKGENKENTFGVLSLEFKSCLIKSDTIEFFFDFVDKKKVVFPYGLKKYVYFTDGVAYNVVTKKKLYLTSKTGFSISEKGLSSRFENPLQPEVKRYIDSNWININCWFKEYSKIYSISNK